VHIYQPGSPSPFFGIATNYDTPTPWYRNAVYGKEMAAKCPATPVSSPEPPSMTQVNAVLLPAHSFPFSIHDYTNADDDAYTGTVNSCAAQTIDGDQIYGWAVRDYQQHD